jgi:excinuclease UvrABC ATPase subunit
VVAFPTLSLASGAIKGWDRRNGYYFALLESLAKHYGFDIERPSSRCRARCSTPSCTARARKKSGSAT